ncbi:fimbrial protein [Lysobacter pythonis]|uniref:Fimbrial protein n=1 Tax=Solilutibacter pythonis TaxID=2483112 RepID=A0A3M2HW77_9GAMM|nr:type 4a pilus biogenesis protein PilO [Lysobacter pythonis]RMH93288.1 fimbrial protein [Lysobacter pythonis]
MSKQNLNLNNIGSWPRNMQWVFCGLAALIILLLAYLLLFSGKKEELEGLAAQEATLRSTFEEKQGQAANLEPLKQQMEQMEQELQQMLRQLPSKTEMPDIIVDISQTALASGIRNELFQPQQEIAREFYAEKPIQLRLVGNYHQFGAFMSGVASLPRVVIMTMHNITLTPKEKNGALALEGTVKTYRYLDENDPEDKQALDAAEAAKKEEAGKK